MDFIQIEKGYQSIDDYVYAENSKFNYIEEYPDYLQLYLPRTAVDPIQPGVLIKNTERIAFGYTLHCPKKDGTFEKYVLKGVIVHQGGLEDGHYTSYIKNTKDNKDWWYFNDSQVSFIPWYTFDIQSFCFGSNNPNDGNVPTAFVVIYQKMIFKIFNHYYM
jgi:hypothetical protein